MGFAAIRVRLIVILVRLPYLLPLLLEAVVYCGEDCTVVQRLPVLKPMFVVPLQLQNADEKEERQSRN